MEIFIIVCHNLSQSGHMPHKASLREASGALVEGFLAHRCAQAYIQEQEPLRRCRCRCRLPQPQVEDCFRAGLHLQHILNDTILVETPTQHRTHLPIVFCPPDFQPSGLSCPALLGYNPKETANPKVPAWKPAAHPETGGGMIWCFADI